ncbi:MAG: FHA domain-containing protein, partial [Calditrichaeota bacterium]
EFSSLDERVLNEGGNSSKTSSPKDESEDFDWDIFNTEESGPLAEETIDEDILKEEVFEQDDSGGRKIYERPYYLLAIYGPYLSRKYKLKFGVNRIGRDTKLNDIVIRETEKGTLDPSISRRHATISYKDGRFFLSDKRSKTRTYVNQKKVDPTEEIPLNLNDEIEIVSDQKSTIFRLVYDEPHDFSPPRKAGTWWVRHGRKVLMAASGLAIIMAFFFIGSSCGKRMTITQKPDRLTFEEQLWYMDEGLPEMNPQDKSQPSNFTRPLAIADFNEDGILDLVFVDKSHHVIALDSKSKEKLWSNSEFQARNNFPLIIEDLNANGIKDILVVDEDTRLHALEGLLGVEIWSSPIFGNKLVTPPAVGDFNGDGIKDVLLCTTDGIVYLGYGEINSIRWKMVTTDQHITGIPSVRDWDQSGSDEAFIGTDEGYVIIIDKTQNGTYKLFDLNEALKQISDNLTGKLIIQNPVVFAQANAKEYMILSTTSGHVLALENESLQFVWHEYLSDSTGTLLPPLTGDLNGDRMDEIVITSGKLIKVKSLQGSDKSLWQVTLDQSPSDFIYAILADLNKDSAAEVCLVNKNGFVYVLNGVDGELLAQIQNENLKIFTPVLVGDLENDGFTDLILRRSDYNIYKIKTNSKIFKGTVIWPQVFSDAQNDNRLNFRLSGATSQFFKIILGALIIMVIIVVNIFPRYRRLRIIQERNSYS